MVDIIVLTYNNLDSTKKCVDHLYKHTDEFNLIIVDNNSTDGTVEYLKNIEQDNLTLHFSPKNLGCVMGRNFAYTLSKDSEYVCFLDSDQFVLSEWVESYMSYIERGYDVIGFEGWQMHPNTLIPFKRSAPSEIYNYVGCGGMFLKREVVDNIGLFDSAFNPMYFEDPDFCWRAYEAGYKICWNEKKRIYHKPHKLLNAERRVYFNRSLNILRDKWKINEMPIFSNPVDK
jgi:hypothetical protein